MATLGVRGWKEEQSQVWEDFLPPEASFTDCDIQCLQIPSSPSLPGRGIYWKGRREGRNRHSFALGCWEQSKCQGSFPDLFCWWEQRTTSEQHWPCLSTCILLWEPLASFDIASHPSVPYLSAHHSAPRALTHLKCMCHRGPTGQVEATWISVLMPAVGCTKIRHWRVILKNKCKWEAQALPGGGVI